MKETPRTVYGPDEINQLFAPVSKRQTKALTGATNNHLHAVASEIDSFEILERACEAANALFPAVSPSEVQAPKHRVKDALPKNHIASYCHRNA